MLFSRAGSDSPELTEVPIVPAEKDYAEIVEEEDDDYCTPAGPPPAHLQLDRQRVRLLDVIGEGQFGNVFRAEYQSPDTTRPMVVAVKTCKTESQAQMGGRFLQEAHAMSQLHHPHIIELIGVCAGQPTWLLIEFAALGQLRSYLITVRPNADTLLLYAQQLCDALTYLESRRFVHRDIAARNLLVATPECIKLADFGLSRLLHSDGCYYKAGRGKLPIKWMAPESINYRRFTSASDVWMFAVCLWEIFTHGIKPFAELKNSEVIVRLESGERLPPPPESCCSPRLYRLMLNCWSFQPTDRPTFAVLKHLLHEIGHEINDELELAESLEAVSCEPIDNVRKVAPRPVSQFVSPYSMIDAIGDQSTESESIGTETIEQLFLPENANPDESSLHSEYDTSSTTELSVKKRLENENEEEEAKVKSVERLESICRDSLEPDWTERSSFNRSLQMLSNEDDSDNLPSSEHTDLNVTEKRRSQTVPNSPAHSVCNISAPVEIGKGAQLLWSERLKRQQRQSAADAKWLHEEEQQMFGSNQSPGHGSSYSSLGSDLSGLSTQNMTGALF